MRLRRGRREEPGVAALAALTQRFLDGEMDATAFDVMYRETFLSFPLPRGHRFVVLERLAFMCNEYVDVPELREPGDIDDDALMAAARTALRDLGVA